MKLASVFVDHELEMKAGGYPVHLCLRNKHLRAYVHDFLI